MKANYFLIALSFFFSMTMMGQENDDNNESREIYCNYGGEYYGESFRMTISDVHFQPMSILVRVLVFKIQMIRICIIICLLFYGILKPEILSIYV